MWRVFWIFTALALFILEAQCGNQEEFELDKKSLETNDEVESIGLSCFGGDSGEETKAAHRRPHLFYPWRPPIQIHPPKPKPHPPPPHHSQPEDPVCNANSWEIYRDKLCWEKCYQYRMRGGHCVQGYCTCS